MTELPLTARPERLSVPLSFKAPRTLTPSELATFHVVADVLIPATGENPSATSEPDFDKALVIALDARADAFDAIVGILAELDGADTARVDTVLRDLHATRPETFQQVSAVAAGAWLLTPTVRERIGYPGQGRFPAAFDDAANELVDGILDPVLERGSIFTPAP